MSESRDIRIVQLSRMLGLAADVADYGSASSAIARDPAAFANALFDEAVQNDDVLSRESALDYLEMRLAFFGEVTTGHEAAVRDAFRRRLAAWDTPTA